MRHHPPPFVRTLVALAAVSILSGLTAVAVAATVVLDAHAVYPEGPLWHQDALLFVEYGGPGIKRWDSRTKASSTFWQSAGCGPSGLTHFKGDHLLVACYDANTLVELDAAGKTLRTLDKDSAGHTFVGPNDFAVDRSGGLYFSASGVYDLKAPISGAIYHLTATGIMTEVATLIHYSNGLTLSADGLNLLVAEGLAGRILSFPIHPDGTLGARSVWARLRDLAPPTPHEDGYNGPDGLKLGPDGNYYIAQNGSGRVLVVSADKKLVRRINVPTLDVTNMAFGPGNAVYITGVFDPWKMPYPGVVYRWTP